MELSLSNSTNKIGWNREVSAPIEKKSATYHETDCGLNYRNYSTVERN